MKAEQSWCSAVICRNRSDFEMQFRLIVVSIFLKTCVKDRGSTLLISCKAVKRGLQFAIFFRKFRVNEWDSLLLFKVLSPSYYCTHPRLQLGDPTKLNGLSLWTCLHIYFFFFFFFFTGFMRSSRISCPRGVQNRISLEAAMLRWCYSCKKSEASSINTELERLLKIVGSSYPHLLQERSLHFHSLHQPILFFFSSRSIPVEGKLRLSILQLSNLFYSIKNLTFVTTGTGLE